MVIIRNKIREVRESKGLTQREVAERVGFKNQASLSRLERIETAPRARTIEKIAAALGVAPETLVP